MRPRDMKEHCARFDLADLAALDTTRTAGLRGHFSYAMGRRADSILQCLEDERTYSGVTVPGGGRDDMLGVLLHDNR